MRIPKITDLAAPRSTHLAAGLALGLAFTLGIASCSLRGGAPEAGTEAVAVAEVAAPQLLENLGDQHHPITTSSQAAQRYFDQGLILTFGFNHHAAIDSFTEAARLDPACAMCQWGIALAHGPNINWPMGPEAGTAAYAALQRAQQLAPGASERERAYIAALSERYVAEPGADRSALDLAYADAMREVYAADPDDVDAATLFAESLMDLSPWNYWTADAQPGPYTEEFIGVIEKVLAAAPNHVGANHYYIHAVEEYYPERAEAAADRLAPLTPDAGHLVHMPSHIYWRLGRYEDAAEVNRNAAAADEQFFSWCRPGVVYRALYYPHNIHFLWAVSSAEGQSEAALFAARKLQAKTSDQVGEMPFLQEFQVVPLQTLVRFGRWDAVLGEPAPPEGRVYQRGIWHYARGIALARTGEPDRAAAELEALRRVAATPEAEALIIAGGTAASTRLLEIASADLEGELLLASGDASGAIDALERAVAMQDELVYMEPPPWYFPTRHALGATLLDAGRANEAEAVYRRDLEQYPKNGWALFGLARSLEAQGRDAEAAAVRQGFEHAWARADLTLERTRL